MAIKIGDKEIASMLVGTGAGNKEIKEVWQGTNNGNKLVWQSLIIPEGYVLATDSDFSGTTDGSFQYIGTDEYVVIPNVIKGVPVTSYAEMFMENSVIRGVASNNTNVTSMNCMFLGSQATELDLSSFNTSNVIDMGGMFLESQATSLDLSSFNTSNVTSMESMFSYSSVTTLDLSSFDTSNVTDMGYMFQNVSATTLDLSNFDTSNVTSMYGMFEGSSATTLDLSNFDTSNVTNMIAMFYNSSATTLDLSSFDTSSVTDIGYMGSMFQNSSATTGYARTQADADKFNTSSNKPAGLNFILPPPPLATDDDFVKVNGIWVYRGSELEIEIPHIIQGEEVTSYEHMFRGAGSYLATPVTKVVSNNIGVTSMSGMFRNSSATTLDLSNFDTSNVTNMSYMFRDSQATSLDLSSFNTSSVTDMRYMFSTSQATSLDLSHFDTSSVTSMSNMFRASQAISLDLSSFDTSSVTNMSDMFAYLKATILDLSSFDTSSVVYMENMFSGSQVSILDLSSFDTSKAGYMNSMFYQASTTTGYARTQADAYKFNASDGKPAGLTFIVKPDYVLATDDDFVKVSGRWVYRGSELKIEIPHIIQGQEVTSYDYMFYGTGSYSATPVTKVVSNNENVTSMISMFRNSQAISLDLSSFDTSNVTDMGHMFRDSKAITLDLSSFDTSNVTNMMYMFRDSSTTILNLSSFDTSSVIDMNYMFYNSNATTLDLSNFDTSNVTSMYQIFYNSSATTLDLSNFDTSNVTDMGYMFYNSSATTLDLSSFDTSNVIYMDYMFRGSSATTLDLSSFDTSSVTTMSNMFFESSATTLDLSSFDTSNVTDVSRMFYMSPATTGYARTQTDADKFNASDYNPAGLTFVVHPSLFGAPVLTEPGVFLDRWTASGTGTGVGQVYDNMLYLTVSDSNVGDSALFLSDPVKVSSDALDWLMTARNGLGGGMVGNSAPMTPYLHGIPINTIIKIGISLTCTQAAVGTFVPAQFELYMSIMDEDGEPLGGLALMSQIQDPIVSIDWIKFT